MKRPLFPELVRLCERHDVQVLSSVAPMLWVKFATDTSRPLIDMPNDRLFSYLIADGKFCSGGGGLHMSEIYLLECLAYVFDPRRIFIIGNAYGWSTLAMALAFPDARVVAIDSGQSPGSVAGIDWTNKVAHSEGLNAKAVFGSSPVDVARIADDHLGGGPDLVLIDGEHTEHQQAVDFDACKRVAAPECVYLFHDVINWNLGAGLSAVIEANKAAHYGELLTRTASGMGVLYPHELAPRLDNTLRAFIDALAFVPFQS